MLAVGLTRGWRPALTGAAAALAALALIVAVAWPVGGHVPVRALQGVVGVLLLLFGLRWLRKAILRSIGVVALHDEDAAFARETRELREAERRQASGLDWIAGVTSFKAVLLEGVEVVFIVIAVGAGGLLAACERGRARGLRRGGGDRRGGRSAAGAGAGECAQVRGRRHAFGLRPVLDRREPRRRMAGRRRGDPRLRGDVPRRRRRAGCASEAEIDGARMIGEIVKQLIGLFVDDEFLAAAILAAVAVAGALAFLGVSPAWLAGLILTLALPAALASSVLRSAWRARQPTRRV